MSAQSPGGILESRGNAGRDMGLNGADETPSRPLRSNQSGAKGCYTVILNAFETYVYLAGALAIGVLAIELFAMIFAMCLFRGIQ